MNVNDERTRPLWLDTEVAPEAPRLDRDTTADVVVVGSGIAGLSTAYELAARGQKVVVIDRGKIGTGMTARTTAHLASACDDWYADLIERRGLDVAKQFYQSHHAAIDRIEAVQAEEEIACDFRRLDGFLFPALDTDPAELDREVEASREVGITVHDGKGLPFGGLGHLRCLRYPRQGAFHPLKYLRGLARAIERRHGRLFADTCVEKVEEKDGSVTVTTADGRTVTAAAAVVATNSPINDMAAIHSKQAPYRTYAMAFRIPRGALPDALYWDTLDEYHYVRLQPGRNDSDFLIVGGADHKTGEADDFAVRFEALEAWTRNLVPELGEETHRWSGQVMEPVDFTAFTGRNPGEQHVYIHTGDSGQGITHGVVASLMLSRLIVDGTHPWAEAYDPARKTASAIGTFISENLTAVKNFAEYVAPGELGSLDELAPGCGAIIRDGGKKIAAYRDEKGKLMLRSAACTHLGCHVHWNALERCWDCPCHGSHFAVDGTAINGPAFSSLAEADVAAEKVKPQRATSRRRASR
jgi:glycine/D-amino acid oxidase-like deaminating enzyme/nitrite reductase/ring-hydroxylating ferredoxin subunit